MATKITFTDDVGLVSTASNPSGTYRWHVYERTIAGKTAIYVQREVSSVLDPEVKFVPDGGKPRISYDDTLAKWILIYEFNEQSWMLLIDETTAPSERPIQQDTILIHMRTAPDYPDTLDVASAVRESTDSVPSVDAYSSPAQLFSVGVAASPTEGRFRVRWLPKRDESNPPFNENLIGFNVYMKRADTGQIVKLNPSLIPFVDYNIHEYEVPEVGGVYMVTEVERKGRNTTSTAESRLGHPKDEVRADRQLLPTTIRSFMGRAHGEGASPTVAITADYDIINYPTETDNLPHNRGEGFTSSAAITDDFDVIAFPIETDNLPHNRGEGFTSRILLTGYGPIVIG